MRLISLTEFSSNTNPKWLSGDCCAFNFLRRSVDKALKKLINSAKYEGWRMVKSETRWDAEILVKNPSPRLLGKKFWDLSKDKNKPCKNETPRLIKNAFKISRSCQNFARPTFFEVPFGTPNTVVEQAWGFDGSMLAKFFFASSVTAETQWSSIYEYTQQITYRCFPGLLVSSRHRLWASRVITR